MAQICEKCGKKVGVFSNDPLNLSEDRILCFDCASAIRDDLNNLYYVKSIEEFTLLKNEILNKSKNLYNEEITKDIEKITERIFNNTTLTVSEHTEQKRKLIENYMMTTGYEFNGYKITRYMGVISGQVVLGTGFLSEFTASFADFFGEESNKFADKLETAKNAAVEKLIIKSADKGGNAIIGVDFDYITFHGNMIGVVANGTSVVIEKIEE